MTKKIIFAIIAVFIAWSVLDFVIHSVLLKQEYEATASLWRPFDEMKMGLMYAISIAVASIFVLFYYWLVSPRNLKNGLLYGLLFGLFTGINMGFGSYTVMPITNKIAALWFGGTLLELLVAGLIVALIIKE